MAHRDARDGFNAAQHARRVVAAFAVLGRGEVVHLAVAPGGEPGVVMGGGLERRYRSDTDGIKPQLEDPAFEMRGGLAWRKFQRVAQRRLVSAPSRSAPA